METNSHFFYVLLCNDNSLYAGYTNDLQKRLKTHNEGKGAKYTRARRPVLLCHAESFETKREAMQAEYRFKQLTRKKKEQYIEEKRRSKEAVYAKTPDEF
ncbi:MULTISPECIES: GIY-YIG nuclease family protein [Bacillus]|uniref:GIY-YIG nuclease family protein n=1 Tax=Bacillus TaxID=1386 RepID=UPI00025B1879|nr:MULTISPECIES: GIY-YIG nuclease family protein [Bacillus]EIF15494.1 GIY-YIG nuclease superfamily protein [Bacillus sp. 5B6]MEC0954581.1 GIY-YIG nuclease family protein [Bacillus velezensis]MED3704266.1 GIY-YIG nuclease family protein [Bacillus velezensis]QGI74366.1 GIY-YIG nuclease family protein [Bacillus velezensis]QNE09452.1 GIY-YIG nuclease family protein [Bacillus velezensis]